jgi:hypothetical protein
MTGYCAKQCAAADMECRACATESQPEPVPQSGITTPRCAGSQDATPDAAQRSGAAHITASSTMCTYDLVLLGGLTNVGTDFDLLPLQLDALSVQLAHGTRQLTFVLPDLLLQWLRRV